MKRSEQIDNLKRFIPTILQKNHTIVYDQIKGNRYALAEKNENNNHNYAQRVITDFMTYKECFYLLFGMQLMIMIDKKNKKK